MPKSRNRGKKYQPPGKSMAQNQTPKKNQPNSPLVSSTVTTTHFKGQMFSSNYPPPDMMSMYAQVDPEFPNRLLTMAEKEGEHRRKKENLLVKASIFFDLLGMILAPASVIGILYTGYLFMTKGFANEGAWIIGTVTVTLAVAFITRGKRQPKTPEQNK